MSGISKAFERELRRLGRIKNAKGYAAWLGAEATASADRARAEESAKASRLAVDFGASGESLARSGLADDGYAAYLRKAAKQQREARALGIETDRADGATKTLAGYRDYLNALRREDGDRLVEAAHAAVSLERGRLPALNRILDEAEATTAQRQAIGYAYRHHSSEARDKENASTLQYLLEHHYNYKLAYEYCLLLGMEPGLAHRMATASDAALTDNWDKIYELFGDEVDG